MPKNIISMTLFIDYLTNNFAFTAPEDFKGYEVWGYMRSEWSSIQNYMLKLHHKIVNNNNTDVKLKTTTWLEQWISVISA